MIKKFEIHKNRVFSINPIEITLSEAMKEEKD